MNHQSATKADLHTIKADIARKMVEGGGAERVWVACSGGLDSSVLFHLLDQLQREQGTFTLGVLHVNYGLRGAESDRDEALVRQAAERAGRDVRVLTIDPKEHPKEKTGIQEWARDIRYQWFAREMGPNDWIAVAHHRDDWVETIFARLCRGHSLMAVTGMQVLHERIWRPLLDISRHQLESLAREEGIAFGEDSSNRGLDYTRNRLRLQLIPELERLFPGFAANLFMHATDLLDALSLVQATHAALPIGSTLSARDLGDRPPFLARHEIGRFLQAELSGLRLSRDLLMTIHAALVKGSTWIGVLEPGVQAVCKEGVLSIVRNKMPESERWQQFRAALLDESLDVWPPAAP